MSSIIEGYNYDVFISYRQKDNRGERWVSEFVESLKTELESTFKEEISVYFDINPHDGLLETHDVDASLKEKLKCLVFIPVISRTYCDPKSFAWEHEFRAFVEQASQDQFGLKAKLTNGNIASRVLSVKIYDLDEPDIRLCESVLGSVLRGVEFIYKSPGVNRPLRSAEDHPHDNLNKTYYRDQINKVSNAIKEIIKGLEDTSGAMSLDKTHEAERDKPVEEPGKGVNEPGYHKPAPGKKRSIIMSAALLIIALIVLYPRLFGPGRLERLKSSGEKISVVVLPFQNMTGDQGWDIWQDGIQDILINSLSEEIKVRQAESINNLIHGSGLANYASITPSLAGSISQKLEADIFVYGNIKHAGNKIRLYAQLIDTKTNEVYKSFQIEAQSDESLIFSIVDSLSVKVRDFLVISEMERQVDHHDRQQTSTSSPEAYKAFIYGRNEFHKRDYPSARKYLMKAISIDSNFFHAINVLAMSYGNQSNWEQAKKWSQKSFRKIDQMALQQKINTRRIYASFFETPHHEIIWLRQLLDLDEQDAITYYNLGNAYNKLRQYDKAIPEFEKSLKIYNKWGIKPFWALNYTYLGTAYHKNGQYKKEKQLYQKAEEDFPGDILLIRNHFVLSKAAGDTLEANRFAEKAYVYFRSNQLSDAEIASILASAFADAGSYTEAEENYRKALSLDPENPARLNTLAFFLIDNERNVPEGLELVERALQLIPDQYSNLYTKGVGFLKQGKYMEALTLLQRSWELRREKAIYNHEAFLYLEAAKKAVEGKKPPILTNGN